ncbi:AtpZ/AtpI family protein [Hoeflea olei]|uniref:ATP synthase protein I n=1 Tax=Hoeflea olei TaxID=1480615 RepID=A0A1C1YPY1_9HYPH|nr:AtpZ/AtpI family protein [Hoeflea olei]OCW55565.1 ATP synthase subunit I [Hoeflea olei]
MDEKRRPGGPDQEGAGGETENGRADSLEARRQRLDAELLARRTAETGRGSQKDDRQGYALAVKLSSEFIAGVIVGAVLGYGIDRLAGTTPWGLIVFLILGFCAGVLNILRSTGAVAQPGAARAKPDSGRGDDDGN